MSVTYSELEAAFPPGTKVTQVGYGSLFTVVGYGRGGYLILQDPSFDTTHYAPVSQVTIAVDPLVGHLYLLHFDRKVAHAQHYLGFAEKGGLFRRLAQHEAGNGKSSPLVRALQEAGGSFTLARTWIGTRDDERTLKKRRNAPQLCPICRGDAEAPTTIPKGVSA